MPYRQQNSHHGNKIPHYIQHHMKILWKLPTVILITMMNNMPVEILSNMLTNSNEFMRVTREIAE